MSDITTNLRETLPVPPVEPAVGAAFIVLPRRQSDADAILEFYPNAEVDVLHTVSGGDVLIYTVDAQQVREAYGGREGSGDDGSDSAAPG
jgi:hypothetical protein